MATRFYYPAWRKKVEELNNFYAKHIADMIRLNAISGTELDQVNAIGTALSAAVANPNLPKYRELG